MPGRLLLQHLLWIFLLLLLPTVTPSPVKGTSVDAPVATSTIMLTVVPLSDNHLQYIQTKPTQQMRLGSLSHRPYHSVKSLRRSGGAYKLNWRTRPTGKQSWHSDHMVTEWLLLELHPPLLPRLHCNTWYQCFYAYYWSFLLLHFLMLRIFLWMLLRPLLYANNYLTLWQAPSKHTNQAKPTRVFDILAMPALPLYWESCK